MCRRWQRLHLLMAWQRLRKLLFSLLCMRNVGFSNPSCTKICDASYVARAVQHVTVDEDGKGLRL
jgi:hypothetical protein